MRVLVLGHQGMLARELVPCFARAGFAVMSQGRPEVDLTQPASLRRALVEAQPDLLINAAAYTAVDQAEMEPEAALAVNRDGVAHLAALCREGGLPLLHVSTDYVFDGSAAHPYCEDDLAGPLGMYGRSKWEGEEAVRGCHQEHVIVRTAWVYGCHGRNFVKTMLRFAHEREVLRVVDDQYGCPTWSRDLAEALVTICQRIAQGRDRVPWGTYHFCGAGQTTWYGFARVIIAAARAYESLRVQEVVPIPTSAYPTPAKRPAYSILDCTKVQAIFGITPRPWQESLHDCLREIYTCPPIPPAMS